MYGGVGVGTNFWQGAGRALLLPDALGKELRAKCRKPGCTAWDPMPGPRRDGRWGRLHASKREPDGVG
jgi:hypothetical protein